MDGETLVVNFFAGPGTGKSTTTALTFGKLKMAGYNCEIAHEFAKDLTWEGRDKALKFQPYITGKQMFKIERLLGEVDVILTDSPILFGFIYADESLPQSYYDFLADIFFGWETLNIFLQRDSSVRAYNPSGRSQTEEEAIGLDEAILGLLEELAVSFETVPILPDDQTSTLCVDLIKSRLLLDGT